MNNKQSWFTTYLVMGSHRAKKQANSRTKLFPLEKHVCWQVLSITTIVQDYGNHPVSTDKSLVSIAGL